MGAIELRPNTWPFEPIPNCRDLCYTTRFIYFRIRAYDGINANGRVHLVSYANRYGLDKLCASGHVCNVFVKPTPERQCCTLN